MELKLTTKRALQYEERTGKDIFEVCQRIAETNLLRLKDAVELFSAMGDDCTVEKFDEWDVPFADKVVAIVTAIKEYSEGKK